MPSALITGSNRGIGLEFTQQLKDKGYEVFALCRKSSEDLQQCGVQVLENADVRDLKALIHIREKLKGKTLDLLINNAGVLYRDSLEEMNFDQVTEQLEVNALGTLKATHTFLPLLREGSKIIILTSQLGSIGEENSGKRYGYRMSKAAVNMLGRTLAADLKDKKIAIGIYHPGRVRTAMTDFNRGIEPSESVENLLERIEELNLENSGSFWNHKGESILW